MITVYVHKTCSTCKRAIAWLKEKNIAYEAKEIRETPPTIEQLEKALADAGGNIKKILNTSGIDYRGMHLKEKIPQMNTEEILTLISKKGSLCKRPFLVTTDKILTGFNVPLWAKTLKVK